MLKIHLSLYVKKIVNKRNISFQFFQFTTSSSMWFIFILSFGRNRESWNNWVYIQDTRYEGNCFWDVGLLMKTLTVNGLLKNWS